MRELLILCFAYAISLFYRGMISVFAPEISADLSLNESGLGLLSSTFFISFAIAQLPGRLTLDRFGTRLTIGVFMWLAVLGTALFSMAANADLHLLVRRSSVLAVHRYLQDRLLKGISKNCIDAQD